MINYEKYSNMTKRQLLSSLSKAQKKEQKIKADMQRKLNDTKELIKFLKTKMKKASNKEKCYTLENSPAIKKMKKWEEENPQEAEQIRQELEAEMRWYYENPNSSQDW